jgi:peptidyl-prolyl cis-trans isomerase A (cyclophilin A)
LIVTITGTNLAQGLTVASPQCTAMTRSTTAPNASDASTAYYLCTTTAAAPSTVTVSATRSSDGVALQSASFTIGAPTTVAEALAGDGAVAEAPPVLAIAGTAKFSRAMTVTVTGANVNQGLDVSSATCRNMTLSTSPPLVSTASTAYYQCTADVATGLGQVFISPPGNPLTVLANPQFSVDIPEVTLSISRGVGTSAVALGTFVIALEADKASITSLNFLNYVNAGFYDGTIFDLTVKNPAPIAVFGGRYGPTSGSPPPTPKPGNAPIALEVGVGLSNVQWTVGMDRSNDPNSATSAFYVNLVDNPQLDPNLGSAGYAVFGSITSGADVLTQMAQSPCVEAIGFSVCLPGPNIVITSAIQTR